MEAHECNMDEEDLKEILIRHDKNITYYDINGKMKTTTRRKFKQMIIL